MVFAAHTDTVFPDTEPMTYIEDENNIYCPGCGDDSASVAMLMTVIRSIIDSGRKPRKSMIFAFDSCEEGLGNLKGAKAVMDRYINTVSRFYGFDGPYKYLANMSVGSRRYKVTVKTEGGHSYIDFGNRNAAHILAKGIAAVYEINAPQEGGKTTYNVGLISGGTSVNTVAQKAEMVCEYRSESHKNLSYMKERFEEVFDLMRSFGAEVGVEVVGERPCMQNVDEAVMREMTQMCMDIQKKHSGRDVTVISSSTDCNIPLSMGVAAVCVGTYNGEGMHTREEWVEKASIPKGFEIVREIVGYYF